MTFSKTTVALATLTLSLLPANAGDTKSPIVEAPVESAPSNLWDAHRPDSHAPIGVMGDHTHEAGEFMLSYRYGYMFMGESYLGSDTIPDRQIIAPASADGEEYLVTPTDMTTHMHMVGGMYAPTDEVTLFVMVPHVERVMDHLRRDGVKFRTASEGIGDLKFGGLIKFLDQNHQRMHLNLGLSAPTGDIDEEHFIPGPGVTRLPYPMQNGSGTWDVQPGLTYLGQRGNLSWGAQFLATLPLEDENDQGYRLGDAYTLNLWGAYRLSDRASTSLRITGKSWDNIEGFDRNLTIPATVVPTADPSLRGGERIDIFGGLNLYGKNGHRIALEVGTPIYQDLDGPQLGMDWIFQVGWQKAF